LEDAGNHLREPEEQGLKGYFPIFMATLTVLKMSVKPCFLLLGVCGRLVGVWFVVSFLWEDAACGALVTP
jgi:hypothetical protein